MIRKTEKIPGSILLLAGLTPVIFSAFFLIKQQFIRHQMKEELEKGKIVTLRLHASKINWVKKKKEILIEGKMFDVKSMRIDNDTYTITGLFDEDETSLNRFLDQNLTHKKSESAGFLTQLFQWLQTVFPLQNTALRYFPSLMNHNIPYNSPVLLSGFISVLLPPPRN